MENPKTCRFPTESTMNWIDLPAEMTANILHRLGAVEILLSAQMVCTSWYTICKDPSMWRIIDMSNDQSDIFDFHKMCTDAIDRSQGQLIDINFDQYDLLNHVIKRGCRLKRFEIWACYDSLSFCFGEAIKKLPFLEEISLNLTDILEQDFENVGRFCPMLKSLKLNMNKDWYAMYDSDDEKIPNDIEAFIISKYMPQLQHLQLIGNVMSDVGLKTILDACVHLQSLDLRLCSNLEFKGSLLKRCSEQISDLKLPNDSVDSHFVKQQNKALSTIWM